MTIQAFAHPSRRQEDGFLAVTVRVPATNVSRRLDLSYEELQRYCGWKDPLALDFLLIASLCYVTDKSVSRSLASDGWTRELDISLPVSDPERWQSIAEPLSATLNFLTGDVWNLRFQPLATRHWKSQRRKTYYYEFKADAVALFSGGLDSLVGAIDLLEAEPAKKVMLLGHYDAAAGEQSALYPSLYRHYRARSRFVRVRIGHRPEAAMETTLRSRSLVFLSLGFYAARFYGADVPLYASENGVIAINVPLTPSRAGSCSTRTMHPYFLDSLVESLRTIGFTNPLINPLELKTKGECLTECLNPALLQAIASRSVSCSHAARRQHWVRRGANNCGYCVPCLFRRAALHRAGYDDGNSYGFDVCRDELTPAFDGESANDLRALVAFLSGNKSDVELSYEAAMIAPTRDLGARAEMLMRGFNEVRDLFRAKGSSNLQKLAGVAPLKDGL